MDLIVVCSDDDSSTGGDVVDESVSKDDDDLGPSSCWAILFTFDVASPSAATIDAAAILIVFESDEDSDEDDGVDNGDDKGIVVDEGVPDGLDESETKRLIAERRPWNLPTE